jgi:outer membrane lipoprotein SlyB
MTRYGKARLQGRLLIFSAVIVCGVLLVSPLLAQSNVMQRVQYGKIVSADTVVIHDRPSGRGGQAGSTVGAIAGAAIADRGDGLLGALIGGAIGGAIGRASDRAGSTRKGTEVIILLDAGEEVAIQLPGTREFMPGDRVRVTSGPNGTRVQRFSNK